MGGVIAHVGERSGVEISTHAHVVIVISDIIIAVIVTGVTGDVVDRAVCLRFFLLG